jgi:polar amino acid transport system permease protein
VDALNQIAEWMPVLIKATGVTVQLTLMSTATAIVLGVLLALGKISPHKLISAPCTAYVFFFRGTPLLMQLFFIYFLLPQMFPSLVFDRMTAAYIAFSLNVAAYMAEIIRAAIQSIDKGQMEAARSLGLRRGQAMRLVIIPQSYRRMVPPIFNEINLVLKDTSLVAIIGLNDLTFQMKMIAANKASILVFVPAAAIYLILTGALTVLFNRLEKKFAVYE